MKRIPVVAAIIYNTDQNQILIAKRPSHLHKGGYWEFPGGKVKLGENNQAALARELLEEINIGFDRSELFAVIEHDYPEKDVRLMFFKVFGIQGEPFGNEGQELAWVAIDQLSDYRFPEANEAIVAQISG